MTEQPTISTDPTNPDQVVVHFPEFGLLDTQAWSVDVGIPADSLPALRDAITARLAERPQAATSMADTPLPPFSGDDTVCVKCGQKGASTEFRAYGTCLHDLMGGVFGMAPNERLHRQCSHCAYAWDEATVSMPAGPVAGAGALAVVDDSVEDGAPVPLPLMPDGITAAAGMGPGVDAGGRLLAGDEGREPSP